MHEAAPRSGPAHIARSILLLLVGVTLYLFSVGPAAALHGRGVFGSANAAVEAFYYPVSRLYAAIPVIQPLFDVWIELWEEWL